MHTADKMNAGSRWKKWVDRRENVFIGMNIEDDEQKRALLLHYAGEHAYDIYEAEKGDSNSTYAATKDVLANNFEPKKNLQMEIYNFGNCKQKEEQSLDEFVT